MVGQPQGLVDPDLPLAHPVQPDVVVPTLQHILRLHDVLAPAAVPVDLLQPGCIGDNFFSKDPYHTTW